jgi:hypothetical protein
MQGFLDERAGLVVATAVSWFPFLVIAAGAAEPAASAVRHTTDAGAAQITPAARSTRLAPDPSSAAKLRAGEFGFTRLLVTQRHPINSSHVYTYHAEGLQPGGGMWIVDFSSDPPQLKKILDCTEGEILDANLDYDGETILFSWKRTMSEPFQLFTVKLDGSGLTRLTNDDSNNFNACWLPDGGIAFLSDRKPAFAYCWATTTPILYRCERDGSGQTRLSANYLNDFTPSVLSDGRIVYSRWEYVDRPAIPIQSLWTINPDGTGLAGLFGNRILSPATFMDTREIPGRPGHLLCVLTAHNGPCRGAIGIIDPRAGANSSQAITNLTPEIDIGRVDQGDGNRIRGPYLNPFPLDDRHYLVSREGAIEIRDYAGSPALTLLEPASSEPGFYCPQPVRARQRERVVSSALPADPPPTATLVMQDVYAGLGSSVPRGEVKQIAVVQEIEKPLGIDPSKRAFGFQFPVVSCGATYAPKKVWGYARVEADGSAAFKVPAQEPIYFLPLDAEGRAVQRMRTFTHLMPGEVQGCIGCHSDRNSASPMALSGSRIPDAMTREPQELEPPEWGVRGFSYAAIIQPVWDRHCIECHGHHEPAADLELTGDKTDFFNVSYENLARRGTSSETWQQGGVGGPFKTSRFTSWIPTYNGQEENILEIAPGRWGAKASLLAEIVRSGHPDEEGRRRVDLGIHELRRVFAWLDLNCPYYGTSDSNHRERTGCRRIIPEPLDATLKEVAARRCTSCHGEVEGVHSFPNSFYVRIDHPGRNRFLRAPLAKTAGGSGACGEAIFTSTDDPDYRALLDLFNPVQELLARRPRLDMEAIVPHAHDP